MAGHAPPRRPPGSLSSYGGPRAPDVGFRGGPDAHDLAFALIGAILGTLVGVLPGIGPTSGIAILLPLTAVLPPTPAIIMLAAIYYGAMYGSRLLAAWFAGCPGAHEQVDLDCLGEAAAPWRARMGRGRARVTVPDAPTNVPPPLARSL